MPNTLVVEGARKAMPLLLWAFGEEGIPVGAANLEDAPQGLPTEATDIIIVNADLPAAEKRRHIEALRAARPAAAFIDLAPAPADPPYDSGADEYLRTPYRMTELLEKKAPSEQSSAAATRSSVKLREMQALPTDRQLALQKKYQKEWDAVKARLEKAITAGQP